MTRMAELLDESTKRRWTMPNMVEAVRRGEWVRRAGHPDDADALAAYDKKLADYQGKVPSGEDLIEWMHQTLDEVERYLVDGDPKEWVIELEGALTDVEDGISLGVALERIGRVAHDVVLSLRNRAACRMSFLRPEVSVMRRYAEERSNRMPDTTEDGLYDFWGVIADPTELATPRLPLATRRRIIMDAVERYRARSFNDSIV